MQETFYFLISVHIPPKCALLIALSCSENICIQTTKYYYLKNIPSNDQNILRHIDLCQYTQRFHSHFTFSVMNPICYLQRGNSCFHMIPIKMSDITSPVHLHFFAFIPKR